MNRFISASFVSAAVAAGALLAAPQAAADMPGVLSAVPADAPIVLATPDIAQLDKDAGALMAVLGLPEMATPRQLLRGMGFSRGMRADGSAALVLLGGLDTGQPQTAVFLPTSDYDAMVGGFNPQRDAGVDVFTVQGQQAFARKAGGYALISQDRVFAENYVAGDFMADHAARLGPIGADVAEAADIVVIADMASLAPLIEQGAARGGAQAQMALGQLGGIEPIVAAMREEMRVGVLGVQADAMGAGFDLAFTFKEGSEAGAMFDRPGRARAMLEAMPDRPFLFASAIDMTHPGLASIMESMQQVQQQAGGGMNPFGGMGMGGGELFEDAAGSATVIYPNPAGPMMGMLANMMQYYASDEPEALIASTRKNVETMAGAMDGLGFEYTENAAQVEGVALDSWSLTLQGGGDPMTMQLMQGATMMFGSATPSGYIAQTNDGVFATLSRNTALLREAILAESGKADGLADDPSIRAIAARLPDDMVAEGYIGVRGIIESVGPMLQMMGGFRLDAPADLPPVGGGMAADDQTLRMAAYVPAPVMRLASDIARQVQQLQQQGQQGGGGPRF